MLKRIRAQKNVLKDGSEDVGNQVLIGQTCKGEEIEKISVFFFLDDYIYNIYIYRFEHMPVVHVSFDNLFNDSLFFTLSPCCVQ